MTKQPTRLVKAPPILPATFPLASATVRTSLLFLILLAAPLPGGWPATAATPAAPAIPSRQVHLDFHTSELIPEVGQRFSKTNWQEALRLGRVNWINIFAKCHHGWSYYPTQVGQKHPTLERDLMGEQIAACHEMGVRCPLYYTVGWSAHDAQEHPEWRVLNKDGSPAGINYDFQAAPTNTRPFTSWIFLCPSGEYLALMLRQTEELCRRYPVDGFFYDICDVSPPCFCPNCRAGMAAENGNLDDPAAVAAYNARKWKRFFAAAREVIAKHRPQATVFFNGTTKLHRSVEFTMWEHNTQMELEDLPTTWGGYEKFALRSKFFHNTGRPVFAMSGKFHTSWGEFGGFKHPEAMRYEAAAMIAFGASCNFGDQLHPSGEMDLETYRRIGHAFAYAEKIEAYGVGGKPVSRLGFWRTGATSDDEGVSNMLLETQNDYEVVDPAGNLARYDVIVLTGARALRPEHAARLAEFTRQGGGLLVLGESALDREGKRFLLDVGAEYLGPARFENDYLIAGTKLRQGVVATPFLNCRAALRVQPSAAAEILASIREPYFGRTYGAYSSHRNTPNQLEDAPHPGALRHGRVVFLPHRLGDMYYTNGAQLHRQFFANALGQIYTEPMLKAALPTAGRVSLLHQPEHRRYVAHLLYGPPIQRGQCLVIEDLPELRNVPIEVRLPERINRAYLIPGEQKLSLKRDGKVVRAVVPRFSGHCAIAYEY